MLLGRLTEEKVNYNKDEVENITFLELKDLTSFAKNNRLTPWFELILKTKLEEYFKMDKTKLKNETNLKLIKFC